MYMLALMSMLFLGTDDAKYKAATIRSGEAVYEGSDIKGYVNKANDVLRDRFPLVTKVAPIPYAVFVKHTIAWKNDTIAVNANTQTKEGQVAYTWKW